MSARFAAFASILVASATAGNVADAAPIGCPTVGDDLLCGVSDGGSSIRLDLVDNDANPVVNFFDLDQFNIGGVNQIFTHGLFLRVDGGANEELGTPPISLLSASQDEDLNQISLAYSRDLGNGGALTIDVVLTLSEAGAKAAVLDESITITTNTDGPVSFELIQYWDFDLGEFFDDDSAFSSLAALQQSDATTSMTVAVGQGSLAASGHETRECRGGADCSLLASIFAGDDLTNNGGPINDADLTMAFQFAGTLDGRTPSATIQTRTSLSAIPAPAPLGLLGLGLAGLGLARRKGRAAA